MCNTNMANTFDNDTNTQYETLICTKNLPTFDLEMRNELGEEPEVMDSTMEPRQREQSSTCARTRNELGEEPEVVDSAMEPRQRQQYSTCPRTRNELGEEPGVVDSAIEPRQREQYSTCARIGNELGEEPEVVDSAMEPRQRNELDKTHQHVSKKDIEINYTVPGSTSRANPPNKARFQERLGGGMKVPGQVDKSKEKDSKVVVNTIFGKEKEKKQITKMASIFEKKSKVNKVDSAKTNTKEATTNEQRQKQEQSTPTRRKAVAIRRKCSVISEGLVQSRIDGFVRKFGVLEEGHSKTNSKRKTMGEDINLVKSVTKRRKGE